MSDTHHVSVSRQSTLQGNAYLIRSPFLSKRFEHPIAQDEYLRFREAHAFLMGYLRFEEVHKLVLLAFEEFELFLLKTSLNDYVFPSPSYDFSQETRLRANLPILGFLNSVRCFHDQFPKLVDSSRHDVTLKHFKGLWETHRRDSIAFRFGERLRNFAQHQTQPVSSFTTGGAWDSARSALESHMSIYVKVADVCASRDINKNEREAYEDAFGELCDVSLIFREVTGCIGELVQDIRKSLDTSFSAAAEVYENTLEIARGYKNDLVMAEVVFVSNGQDEETTSLFPEFLDRAKRLRVSPVGTNNQKHFVSNRARGHRRRKRA